MKTFQKILSEAVSSKFKETIKQMGPLRAKEIGINSDDYVDVVYDGDIVQYVTKHTPFLIHLKSYEEGGGKYILKFEDDRYSSLNGTVMEYFPNLESRGKQNTGWIHHDRWTFLKDYMSKSQFMDFMNKYYDLNMNRLYGAGD